MILIAHATLNNAIGKGNSLLFSLPLDMKFFRETTTDNVIIMGRKTLESFPGKKPLKNRVNIVLTKNRDYQGEDFITVSTPEEAVKVCENYKDKKIFVIGGGSIYDLFLPYCNTALITRVMENADADTFIHDFDKDSDWYLEKESEPIEDNGHTIKFLTYKRR